MGIGKLYTHFIRDTGSTAQNASIHPANCMAAGQFRHDQDDLLKFKLSLTTREKVR